MKTIQLQSIIPETVAHERLDIALTKLFPDYSRSLIQQWIKNGSVRVNDHLIQKPRCTVQAGQVVQVNAELVENTEWNAQPISLSVIFEDDYLMVINKPIGLVVHPGAGNPDNTVVNALLHHCSDLSSIPRAGIIHRLDKDTSGLLIVAKTLPVHNALIKQMQARDIHREYRAIVHGHIISGGTIDLPMGRHPMHRTKMAVRELGKPAVTHYRVLEHFPKHTLLSVQLETGRTHQIRVHFAHYHHPLVGDPTYGKRGQYQSPELSLATQTALNNFKHQALHAYKLKLIHPITKKQCEWKAPLPDDFEQLIHALREN